MPFTDSGRSQKLDGFPLESLDAFDRNHWMTSIGISGCFRLELVDGLPRNTHSNGRSEETLIQQCGKGRVHPFRNAMNSAV